tara:strand:+ start:289 stop:435 length:147 start_codon:yes stop_codon:yes gene_type:complete
VKEEAIKKIMIPTTEEFDGEKSSECPITKVMLYLLTVRAKVKITKKTK